MDPLTAAVLVVVCFVFYRMIKVAVNVLKILLFSDYPKAEELPSLPFVGHAYLFIGGTEAILNRINELGKKYPTSIRVLFGYNSEIILSPKTVEKNFFYQFARPWLGDGLITAPASLWEVHRKLLQPSFNSIALKSFIQTFVTQSAILAKKLERHLDGPEFEILRSISLCTLDAIGATAMGINLQSQENENCQFEEAAHKVCTGFAIRAASPWLYPDFIFYRTRLGKDQTKYVKFIHELDENVIQQKKEEIVRRSDQRVSTSNEQDFYGKYHTMQTQLLSSASIDFLIENDAAAPQLLIENLLRLSIDKKTLTDKEVRDHVDTTIVAGSETTAITLNYMMLMIASHQDIQEKIYQELCDIFGEHILDDDSEELHITMEALARMTYTERVIKETMRLFPAAPIIGRKATDDLDSGQCTLPKGTMFLLNILGVHRSETYWPNPLKFDPDRFSPERFAKQEPFSYLPFSGGRRNCIGSKYSVLLMKTITATILRKYVLIKDKVIPVKDVRLTFDIVLRSVYPHTVRIERRVK